VKRMPNAVPIKIILKNFGSHKNTEVRFHREGGNAVDRCFITGSSGKGKSHVLEAMQYVLGKRIENENEFYHYQDEEINGKKQKAYRDHALIELDILNCGPEYLVKYPRDQVLTIGLEAFRGNARKNRRYIRLQDGIEKKVTLEELKQFGVYNDPLTFIDDQQTDYWVRASPKQRYEKVAQFMGIESLRENVRSAREALQKASGHLSKSEDDLEKARISFASIEEKYFRFGEKQKIMEEICSLETNIAHASIFKNSDEYFEKEEIFYQQLELNETLNLQREKLRRSISNNKARIEKLRHEIFSLTEERGALQEKYNQVITDITTYERNFQAQLKLIADKKLKLPSLGDKDPLSAQKQTLEMEMSDLKATIIPLEKKYIEQKKLLELRKRDQIQIPRDTRKLLANLRESGIFCELLYETLEFKDGMNKWIELVETLLNRDKFGIVVNEEDRQKAEEINRKCQLDAVILSPRKAFVREPHSKLRNWTDILNVDPHKVRKETLANLLHLMFGATYFARDSEEKESFLQDQPRSQIICLDGYRYNIYSQRKFLRRKPSFVIGKGAKEKEIQRIEQEIKGIKQRVDELQLELQQKSKNNDDIKILIDYLGLIEEEEIINEKRGEVKRIQERLGEINRYLANPEEQIKWLEKEINSDNERREEVMLKIEECHSALDDLQNILSEFARNFYRSLLSWGELVRTDTENVGATPITIPTRDDLIGQYQERGYSFVGIHRKANTFLEQIKGPETSIEELKLILEKRKAKLEAYDDVNQTIVEEYKQKEQEVETFKKLLENYRNELETCEEKFTNAVDQLENVLAKWRDSVNRKFKSILQGLEMDGKFEFTKDQKTDGEYELDLLVANIKGGSTDSIENVRFSKGERLRVSIAFEMAILTQSKSPYFVWDEFDQNIGDDHRELLANMIAEHLPDRKLIAISPRRLVRGYVKIFPQILMVWKNDDQNSVISEYRVTEDVRQRGDLLDVFQET